MFIVMMLTASTGYWGAGAGGRDLEDALRGAGEVLVDAVACIGYRVLSISIITTISIAMIQLLLINI